MTSREVRAGCIVCHIDEAKWTGLNAQAVAARHHDKTGHAVWVDIRVKIEYGKRGSDPRQIALFENSPR